MTLSVQALTLLAMVGTGMGMAWFYDLYTWFRKKINPHSAFVFLFDLMYWVLFSIAVFWVLIRMNDGRVRFTLFFALIIGGLCYFKIFSRPFLQVWEIVIDWITQAFLFLSRLAYYLLIVPVKWLFGLIMTVLVAIGSALWSMIRWIISLIQRITLALVRNLGTILVRLFKKKKE